MMFLCPKDNTFRRDFENCEKCDNKEICVNYTYEKDFQKTENLQEVK